MAGEPKETKMQATLTGYLEWVFNGLLDRGEKNYELTKRVFREWCEFNEERLAKRGLSENHYRQATGGNVADLELKRRARRERNGSDKSDV